jgi:hypothetical protein
VITISRTEVFVNDQPVVAINSDRRELARSGVDARFKRADDPLFVIPIADALRASGARLDGGGSTMGELLVAADSSTPFRLVAEVLHTASAVGCDKVGFLVRGGAVEAEPHVTSPSVVSSPNGLELTVFISSEGVAFKAAPGNIAPGCAGIGPGLAVPAIAGKLDPPGIRACASRIKDDYPGEVSVKIGAAPDVDLGRIVTTIDALSKSKGRELFPRASFLVPNASAD